MMESTKHSANAALGAGNRNIDPITLIAMSVVVVLACSFLHEAVGHAGMANVLGVKVVRITSSYARQRDATETQARFIAAAGIPVNLLFGVAAVAYARFRTRDEHDSMHYFLWLFGYTSILSGANYMVGFAFLQVGDVNMIVRGLPNESVWRSGIMVAGLILMCVAWYFAAKTFIRFVGGEENMRRRGALLTVVPYLVMGCVSTGTAVVFHDGSLPFWLVLLSAGGSTFGSNSFLLWMNLFLRKSGTAPTLSLPRNTGWIGTGVVCLLLFCLLARGIDF